MKFAIAALIALLFAPAASAETWYLMAADPKAISQPHAATSMAKGAVAGPIRFTSRGDFETRANCESDRTKLVQDWTRHSIIARGGWSHFGFTSPNVFAQCIAKSDPRLSKSAATPTMDILLQTRRVRGR
jgi:hypothetical protein